MKTNKCIIFTIFIIFIGYSSIAKMNVVSHEHRIIDSLIHDGRITLADRDRLCEYIDAIRSWLVGSGRAKEDTIDVITERMLKGHTVVDVMRMGELARLLDRNEEMSACLRMQSELARDSLEDLIAGRQYKDKRNELKEFERLIQLSNTRGTQKLPQLDLMTEPNKGTGLPKDQPRGGKL